MRLLDSALTGQMRFSLFNIAATGAANNGFATNGAFIGCCTSVLAGADIASPGGRRGN